MVTIFGVILNNKDEVSLASAAVVRFISSLNELFLKFYSKNYLISTLISSIIKARA